MTDKLYQLNSKGISCYYRNQDIKNIPISHYFKIIQESYDSGRTIYLVYSVYDNQLRDYYFEECITEVIEFIRKTDY